MLVIRLQRVGRRNDPNFRVIITDSRRAPKSGTYLEMLGSYEPRKKRLSLKKERIEYWLTKGAQISETARHLLTKYNKGV